MPLRRFRKTTKKRVTKKRVVRSLNKLQKLEVKRLVRGQIESKYCSKGYIENQPVESIMVSGGGDTNFYSVIPAMVQGTESYQRIGTRITPSKFLVNVQLDFDPAFALNFDGWVRIYFVTHKTYKSQDDLETIPAGQFLDDGNGTEQDWNRDNPSTSAMLPVKNEYWTVLKQKTFRMSKNVAATSGSATNTYATNVGHSSHLHTFKLKCPRLIYNDSKDLQEASNHAIFMGVVYWASDSFKTTNVTDDVIRITARSHMYYKDA